MNKQIQELADQAKKSVPHGLGVDKWIEVYNEKFAELIVRECLTVINQPNGVGDDDVIRISRDVKKHFGVKQ